MNKSMIAWTGKRHDHFVLFASLQTHLGITFVFLQNLLTSIVFMIESWEPDTHSISVTWIWYISFCALSAFCGAVLRVLHFGCGIFDLRPCPMLPRLLWFLYFWNGAEDEARKLRRVDQRQKDNGTCELFPGKWGRRTDKSQLIVWWFAPLQYMCMRV